MSGGTSASNNWTIVTPEETVAETLRPLAEGTEHHEEASAADSEANLPGGSEASAVGSPLEEDMVLEELIPHTSTEQHTSTPPALSDAPVPTLLEASCSFVPGSDASNHPGDVPKDLAQTRPDPDSFSDSYTHISPSTDDPPASLLSTETLGGEESTHEEERLLQEGVLHPLQGEELQQEEDQSDLSPSMTETEAQAGCPPVDSEVCEERTVRTEDQGDPEVRRRRRSLLAALEQIGRREEEEDREEDFQVPPRADDSGFTLNKCILGAVILLGLGTIFFSESDYGTGELKDSEVPGKQEWLHPEVPPPPADADGTEEALLNKLAKGSQQISVLQAQLQAQKEELKLATEQAAEGAVERLLREEMEKENSRLKTEMESLLLLQKEHERLKQELESVPALQKELETLRWTVTELKQSSAGEAARAPSKPSTSPLSGQAEDSRQDTTKVREASKTWNEKKTDWKKEKYDTGEKKEWKERERSELKEKEKKERKDGGKIEGKKGKHEQVKSEKMKDDEGKQKRHSKESKIKENEGKKEKYSRGDEGKTWKAKEERKERVERKDWKEEKDWKKGKYEKSDGKQEKDWKREKDYGEKHKGREEWKQEKEWKKVNNDFKGSGKEKMEKKDWKKKGEEKDSEWRSKNGKDRGKVGKRGDENKPWEENENNRKNYGKERNWEDEKKQWNENERKSKNGKDVKEWKMKDEGNDRMKKEDDGKREQKKREHTGERKKDGSSSQKHEDEHKMSDIHPHDPHGESVWAEQKGPHSRRRLAPGQLEYWVQQRERLRHSPRPPPHCDTLETCAQTEGLLPVPFSEFDTIVQSYLAKAEEAGVDASQREQLKKLAAEFFKDGVFLHDQISFEDFVEDVEDILEDMVEGVENGEEVDSTIEEEMDEFEREVMEKFSVPGAAKKKERVLGEQKKESRRGHG